MKIYTTRIRPEPTPFPLHFVQKASNSVQSPFPSALPPFNSHLISMSRNCVMIPESFQLRCGNFATLMSSATPALEMAMGSLRIPRTMVPVVKNYNHI